MQEDKVILVNEQDEILGYMPKLEAHEKGVLHRAISVFLFASNGDLLLQQRAKHKYHSAGLWSNTCCSHPLPDEDTKQAATRRLQQEMGIETELDFLYSFIYNASLENDLKEYEYDHIFVGTTDKQPIINTHEVADWKYLSAASIQDDIEINPSHYTVWFKIALEKVLSLTASKKIII